MTLSLNVSGPLFAGTGLTISCTVSLDPSVNNNERVSIDWSGLPSERLTTTPAMRVYDHNYTITLTISPLADQNAGTIVCTGRVTGDTENQTATNASNIYISVTGRCI